MRRIAAFAPVVLLVLAAACSRNVEASSEPMPVVVAGTDPTGVYDFTATMGIETRTGVLTVTRSGAGYGGTATVEGEPEAATITSASVAGNVVTIDIEAPGGENFRFTLTMDGNRFSGNVNANGQTIPVTGSKR